MSRPGLAALAATAVALGLCAASSEAQTVVLVPVTSGVSSPTYVTHAGDGSARLFIVSQTGLVHVFDGAQILPTPVLDIRSLVSCCGERGLFSVAFHPSYASNGFFYVNYTDNGGDTVVARYTVSADPDVADDGSALRVLAVAQDSSNHNGGQLDFGPDGYLYIGMGDGGGSGDPNNRGQDLASLLGKLLRIDVDGGSPYAIPNDNPYLGEPGEDEIWASGLRNPWRFSFDRFNGDLFIADVGQGRLEEIDFQPVASTGCENYGWRRMEGTLCFNPSSGCQPGVPSACNPEGTLTLPILEYSHTSGRCSITGGYRYRGSEVPEIRGQYIYGDFCTGEIWGAADDSTEDRVRYLGPPDGEGARPTGNQAWSSALLIDAPFNISSFGEDESGELYVVDLSGTIYRVSSPMVMSPPSGIYSAHQELDLVITIYDRGIDLESLSITIGGRNREALLSRCFSGASWPSGGRTLRCPDFSRDLSTGYRAIELSARRYDGQRVSRSVTWKIEAAVER